MDSSFSASLSCLYCVARKGTGSAWGTGHVEGARGRLTSVMRRLSAVLAVLRDMVARSECGCRECVWSRGEEKEAVQEHAAAALERPTGCGPNSLLALGLLDDDREL